MENTLTYILNWKELLRVINYQSHKRCCSQLFYKKAVLKNFSKFTGDHLRWSLLSLRSIPQKVFEEIFRATSTDVKKSITISEVISPFLYTIFRIRSIAYVSIARNIGSFGWAILLIILFRAIEKAITKIAEIFQMEIKNWNV